MHVVQHTQCEDAKRARELLTRIESFGGEGLILRDARCSTYKVGRTKSDRTLLKLKRQHDSEARLEQRVRSKDSWWASTVEHGSLFKVSSGGAGRHTLEAGAVITYSYYGLVHADGGPRFPSIHHVHVPDCGCRACALSRGDVPGETWPVAAAWRVAPSTMELIKVAPAPSGVHPGG